MGAALTLERADGVLPDADRKDLLARMVKGARKLDRLVNDLLDLERLSTDPSSPRRELIARVAEESSLAAEHALHVDARPVVTSHIRTPGDRGADREPLRRAGFGATATCCDPHPMRLFGRMSRRRRIVTALLTVLALVAVFGIVNNSAWLAAERTGGPLLLAHRGLAQTFSFEGITGDTCTAERIHPPEHPYLENTLASMRAAFDAGADVVEFDVQLTADGRFAVFHDATLECRTDGTGTVRDHTLAELRLLDIGYGYTADGGASFPFRGQGVGLMPSLEEVLDAFPDSELLIDVKRDDAVEGERLADVLSALPADRLARLAAMGGDAAIAALERRLPSLRVMSGSILRDCLLPYLAAGWTGYVSGACDNRQIHVPERYAPWLWGWPDRFLDRMDAHGTRVVVVAGSGPYSEGFDAPADLARLPADFTGGVWTNRIDVVAPLLRGAGG